MEDEIFFFLSCIQQYLTSISCLEESLSESSNIFYLIVEKAISGTPNRPERYLVSSKINEYLKWTTEPQWAEDFIYSFRISQASFHAILHELKEQGNWKLGGWSPEIELLVFLRWMAGGSTLITNKLSFGIPISTIDDICNRVLEKVYRLAPKVIKIPQTTEEMQSIAKQFEKKAGLRVFSHCVGALDGSLISLYPPKDRAHQYIDRHQKFSLNLTAICDAKGKFLWITTGYPGQVHDSKVFMTSSFVKRGRFPRNPYYIVADSAYSAITEPIIVIPVYKKRNGQSLTQEQRAFNFHISKMRVAIERAFGLLKVRWRVLLHQLRYLNIEKAINVIVACCVLHNICLLDVPAFERVCGSTTLTEEEILRSTSSETFRDISNDSPTNSHEDIEIDAILSSSYRDQLCEQLSSMNIDYDEEFPNFEWWRQFA